MTKVVFQAQKKGLINPTLIDSVRQTLAGQGSALCNLSQQTHSHQYSKPSY